MQTRNPILDEFAKLTTGAMGLAQAAGEEARAAFRAQTDRVAAEMDLVRRDEFDALKAEVAALRAEVAALKSAATATTGPVPGATPGTEKKAGAKATQKPAKGTSTGGTPASDAAG